MNKLQVSLLALLIVGIMVIGACGESEAPEEEQIEEQAEEVEETLSGELNVVGSTTVQPLAERLAEGFEAVYPEVRINVGGGGSSVGVKSAGEGSADIGCASREIKDSEIEENPDLVIHTIARDGIAIAAHPDIELDDLALEDIRAIFAGEITNASEVGGPDLELTVVSREEGSGTRGAFEDMVMGEALIGESAILQPSNGAVRTTVSTTPGSIGYLSFGYLDSSVRTIKINGVPPTEETAASGEYPVVRPLNMVTNGQPQGVAEAWLDFIMSADGQAIVVEEGYLAVN